MFENLHPLLLPHLDEILSMKTRPYFKRGLFSRAMNWKVQNLFSLVKQWRKILAVYPLTATSCRFEPVLDNCVWLYCIALHDLYIV